MDATSIYICHYRSVFGSITLAGDGETLSGLWFERQARYPSTLPDFHTATVRASCSLPLFSETVRWLDTYFSGRAPEFTPPLRPAGTAFQQRVWELVREIPYGQSTSYGEIARRLTQERSTLSPIAGKKQNPVSARAVGQAVASNPILIITPCHRVIGADGLMRGYAGGLDRQAQLRSFERGTAVALQ